MLVNFIFILILGMFILSSYTMDRAMVYIVSTQKFVADISNKSLLRSVYVHLYSSHIYSSYHS